MISAMAGWHHHWEIVRHSNRLRRCFCGGFYSQRECTRGRECLRHTLGGGYWHQAMVAYDHATGEEKLEVLGAYPEFDPESLRQHVSQTAPLFERIMQRGGVPPLPQDATRAECSWRRLGVNLIKLKLPDRCVNVGQQPTRRNYSATMP